MNFQQLKQQLSVAFPKVWIKDGAEFSAHYSDSLWTGEGSAIDLADPEDGTDIGQIPAFDMYSIAESLYTFGVYNGLHNFLEARGFYIEAYDGGTYFIYQN